MNIVAKKTRHERKCVVDSVKTYDEKTKRFGYFQRLIKYFENGESKTGEWGRITRATYELEDSPQITYDNHP
jgi:hypothetical protein